MNKTQTTEKTKNTCECLTIFSTADDVLHVGTCGDETARKFCPGHDARTKSTLQKAHRTGRKLVHQNGTTYTAAELAKIYGYERFLTDAPKRKSRAKTTQDDQPETRQVKVGRWAYPVLNVGELIDGKHVVAYLKRDGSIASTVVVPSALIAGEV